MAHGAERSAQKAIVKLAQGRKIGERFNETARPVYEQGYGKAWNAAYDASGMPAMRGGYETARRGLRGSMSRYGLGGSGIESSRMAGLNNRWGDQIAQKQMESARMRMGLSGLALQGGQAGADTAMGGYRASAQGFQNQAQSLGAQEQADAAANAGMVGNLTDAAIQAAMLGADIYTGGATIPAHAAMTGAQMRRRGQ